MDEEKYSLEQFRKMGGTLNSPPKNCKVCKKTFYGTNKGCCSKECKQIANIEYLKAWRQKKKTQVLIAPSNTEIQAPQTKGEFQLLLEALQGIHRELRIRNAHDGSLDGKPIIEPGE
jgi:predicted nucleic acid-binding Zn ribbon protein